MEDEILRDLTASERLTLDEEYEMQSAYPESNLCRNDSSLTEKWRLDEDSKIS